MLLYFKDSFTILLNLTHFGAVYSFASFHVQKEILYKLSQIWKGLDRNPFCRKSIYRTVGYNAF